MEEALTKRELKKSRNQKGLNLNLKEEIVGQFNLKLFQNFKSYEEVKNCGKDSLLKRDGKKVTRWAISRHNKVSAANHCNSAADQSLISL